MRVTLPSRLIAAFAPLLLLPLGACSLSRSERVEHPAPAIAAHGDTIRLVSTPPKKSGPTLLTLEQLRERLRADSARRLGARDSAARLASKPGAVAKTGPAVAEAPRKGAPVRLIPLPGRAADPTTQRPAPAPATAVAPVAVDTVTRVVSDAASAKAAPNTIGVAPVAPPPAGPPTGATISSTTASVTPVPTGSPKPESQPTRTLGSGKAINTATRKATTPVAQPVVKPAAPASSLPVVASAVATRDTSPRAGQDVAVLIPPAERVTDSLRLALGPGDVVSTSTRDAREAQGSVARGGATSASALSKSHVAAARGRKGRSRAPAPAATVAIGTSKGKLGRVAPVPTAATPATDTLAIPADTAEALAVVLPERARTAAPVRAVPLPSAGATVATAAERTPPGGRWIKRVGRRAIVSVTFNGDPLQDVLALFSSYSGLSIIPSDEKSLQERTVTGEIHDQPWYAALEALLDANGLRPQQDSVTGIVTVVSKQAAIEDRVPFIIRLRYVDASAIQPTLQKMVAEPSQQDSDKDRVQQDAVDVVSSGNSSAPSRTLVVYTSPAKLEKVKDMVAMLDRARPTVMISAKLAFVNRSRMERLGFNYSIVPAPRTVTTGEGSASPSVQVSPIGGQNSVLYQTAPSSQSSTGAFSFLKELALSGNVNLNLFLDVTQSHGLSEVETAPSITVLTDEPATIAVGAAMILPTPAPIVTATSASSWGQAVYIPGQSVGYQVPNYGANGGQFPQQGGYPQGGYPQGGYPQGTPGGINQNGAGQIYAGGMGGWGQFQTGTTLKVTPYVLENGKVRMKLDITHDGSTLGADGRTISGPKQSVQNEVIIQDNELLVVGGLTTVQRTNTVTGVPLLSSLPLLGNLFKRTEAATLNQDLVILVTPHIIQDQSDNTPIIEALPSSAARGLPIAPRKP